MEVQIQDHANRIRRLEDNDIKREEEMKNLKSQVDNLDRNVLAEGRETRQLLRDLITNRADNKTKIETTKITSKKDIWVAALSAGGILTIVFTAIQKFIG